MKIPLKRGWSLPHRLKAHVKCPTWVQPPPPSPPPPPPSSTTVALVRFLGAVNLRRSFCPIGHNSAFATKDLISHGASRRADMTWEGFLVEMAAPLTLLLILAVTIRAALYRSSLADLIAERVEVVSPLTAWKRGKQGFHSFWPIL